MGGTEWSASIVFAAAMAIILLLTPMFVGAIPKLVVAVLLLYMAAHIIDPWAKGQILSWWRKEGDAEFRSHLRSNLSVMATVMGVAITFNLVAAMAVGVFLAMFLFVRHNSRSIISRIYFGNKRHSSVMRTLAHVELLKSRGDQIALVELDGPLFFGSGDLLKEEIEALSKHARHVILDFRQVGTIDASGAGAVQRIAHRLHKHHARLTLASLSPGSSQGRMIRESAKHNALPEDCWFESADRALEAAEDILLEASGIHEAETTNRMIHLDALRDLDDEQVARLLDYTEENVYQNGALLFRRNDPGNTLYLLLSGQVEIHVPVKGAPSRRLVALRSGTLFGEMAVLRGLPRSADAIVTSDNTEILSLTKGELDRLHQEHPDIALTLMRNIGVHLAARLASVTDELRYALANSEAQTAPRN
jgi:SulP family sulfate permease